MIDNDTQFIADSTAQTLRDALELTRTQGQSITLNQVARIMKEVYDEAELRAIINEL